MRGSILGQAVVILLLGGALPAACQAAPIPAPRKAPARFRDRGDYVEDTKTGLLWQKDGTASGKRDYHGAKEYAAGLKLGRLTGWRVPTRGELKAIVPAVEAPFKNTKYNKHPYAKGQGEWSSYWTADLDTRLPNYAYIYQWYAKGGANNCYTSNAGYVRCVRDPVKKK
jgi:hypothetical protein